MFGSKNKGITKLPDYIAVNSKVIRMWKVVVMACFNVLCLMD